MATKVARGRWTGEQPTGDQAIRVEQRIKSTVGGVLGDVRSGVLCL